MTALNKQEKRQKQRYLKHSTTLYSPRSTGRGSNGRSSMSFASFFPAWLDALLIAPFRVPDNAVLGMWFGCTILALYCTIIGELTGCILFLCNKKYYIDLQDKMVQAHNLSVQALQAQDKASYIAINKTAHEHFGKSFFAQAAVSTSTLWPVPFALGWLALRFTGVPIHSIPFTSHTLSFPFVMLSCYIIIRILFSKYKKYLPIFKTVYRIQQQAKEVRGPMKSFFAQNPPHSIADTTQPKA